MIRWLGDITLLLGVGIASVAIDVIRTTAVVVPGSR
jgi:hypothetical protein